MMQSGTLRQRKLVPTDVACKCAVCIRMSSKIKSMFKSDKGGADCESIIDRVRYSLLLRQRTCSCCNAVV